MAIVEGLVVGLFVKNLLNELGWCITDLVTRSDSSAGRGMASRLGVGRRSKHLETKSLFAQHVIKDGLVMLEAVHTKVNTADIGTKYLDAPTMRKLIGMLGVRLLTLDGAEVARCESTLHAQSGDWYVFVRVAVVTAIVIVSTTWWNGRRVCVADAETHTETEDETDDEIAKNETQRLK